MSKKYNGFFQAKIVSYSAKSRTARVTIPTITDGIDEGIMASFAYPVGHDDRDTELEILTNADCYIFFQQGEPSSPVIWAYSSHGKGNVIDYHRIRQENIELLARVNIRLNAEDTIHLSAKNLIIDAENVTINTAEHKVNGNSTTTGTSDLKGDLKVNDQPYKLHAHLNVKSGSDESGIVA